MATLTASNLAATVQRTANVTITSTTLLLGTKLVKGDRDAGYVGFGTIGQTTRGGSAAYQADHRQHQRHTGPQRRGHRHVADPG